jgi:hypothetical protein
MPRTVRKNLTVGVHERQAARISATWTNLSSERSLTLVEEPEYELITKDPGAASVPLDDTAHPLRSEHLA